MFNLAELQRGLLSLLKERPLQTPPDSYLQRVAVSEELRLVREIALWWRAFSLESYCIFTAKLLHRLGIFDGAVERYFCEHATSPFIEQLSQDFLAWISAHDNPLVASMARFERALLSVKRGDSEVYQVEWNRNPESLFSALLHGNELPQAETDCIYTTTVSAHIPKLVSCERAKTASSAR